jgi:hypothetical protein
VERWGGRSIPLGEFLFSLAITFDRPSLVWTFTEAWCGPGGVAVILGRGERLYVGVGTQADCVKALDLRLTSLGAAETMARTARWIRHRDRGSLPIQPLSENIKHSSRVAGLVARIDAFYCATESALAGRLLTSAEALAAAERRQTGSDYREGFVEARAVRQRLAGLHANDTLSGL